MDEDMISKFKGPLVGVREMVEKRRGFYINYFCKLCHLLCGSLTDDFFNHLISKNHCLNYFKEYFPSYFDIYSKTSKEKQKNILNDLCLKVENEMGRGNFSIEIQDEEEDDERDLTINIERLKTIPNIFSLIQRIGSHSSFKSVASLMNSFSEDLITSDQDADDVFKVIQKLNQEINDYENKEKNS